MKNKFSKLILALLVVVGLSSCEDFLNPEPTDFIVAEKAFETVTDAEQALFGVYSQLIDAASSNIILNSRLADNLRIGQGNRGQGIFIHSWGYTSADGSVGEIWRDYYEVAKRSNIVLENIGLVAVANDDEAALVEQIRGEALALRAFAHFQCVQYFAPAYRNGAGGAGIPYKGSGVLNVTEETGRASVGDVYTSIMQDLTDSKALLAGSTSTDITRIRPITIDAIMARIYLAQENWTQASSSASDVINAFGGLSALESGVGYLNMFVEDTPGEVIFKLPIPSNGLSMGDQFWESSTADNFFAPSDDLIDSYENGDVRDNLVWDFEPTANSGTGENIVTKYPGRTGVNPGINDLKIIRLSEMVLVRAEADWRANGGGLNDLNAVRDARGASTGSESGQTLFDAIIVERRKELCFEGLRWFDHLRIGADVVRGADCNTGECTLSASDYRMVLPIPEDEMLANGSMSQNTGY